MNVSKLNKNAQKDSECVFCKIIDGSLPSRMVYEDDMVVVFLDKHPQSRGHLQLVPRLHTRWIWEHPHMDTVFGTAGRIIRAIIPALGATHVTIATYGKEIAHAHVWIVPRYGKENALIEGKRSSRSEEGQQEVATLLKQTLEKEV